MDRVLAWSEVGRELRQRAGVKSRVPLATFVRFGPPDLELGPLGTEADELLSEELNVRSTRHEPSYDPGTYPGSDWVVRTEGETVTAALSRTPTPELRQEGMVREILRRLQLLRKELDLDYLDPVEITLYASGEWLTAVMVGESTIRKEVLAERLAIEPGPAPPNVTVRRFELDGQVLEVAMAPLTAPASDS